MSLFSAPFRCFIVAAIAILVGGLSALNAQSQPPASDSSYYFLEQYFRLTPLQRLERMDSIIKAKGSSITVSLIDQDLRSLLGDTTSVIKHCSTSGLSMRITSSDAKKVAALKKTWKEKIQRKAYDKTPASCPYAVFAGDSTQTDSLTTFLEIYLKLPVRGRIFFFDEYMGQISPSMITIIAADMNAITGCGENPLIVYNGKRVLDMTKVENSIRCWRKTLDLK